MDERLIEYCHYSLSASSVRKIRSKHIIKKISITYVFFKKNKY